MLDRSCAFGPRTIVSADKAYDADRIRELIQERGATPNIPPKRNRRWKPCFSKRLYREHNLIERFFSKRKHFRRVATRYDKLAANFLATVQLASIRLWLRAYESTDQLIAVRLPSPRAATEQRDELQHRLDAGGAAPRALKRPDTEHGD